MLAYTLLATITMAVAAMAAPADQPSLRGPSTRSPSLTTPPPTGVTHRVVAATRVGQLIFDPDNVVAEVGDIVEWQFLAATGGASLLPTNHSVAQSSFAAPCVPDADVSVSFFSGFQPTGSLAASPNVFQIMVVDTNPIWYYCAQTNNSHCQKGMAGVINQNFNSPNTLAAYKANAALTQVSIVPPVQGGSVILNPHPNDGA